MELCPECGAMLLPKDDTQECNCGYTKNLSDNNQYEVSKKIEEHESVKMLGDVDDMRSTINETCPECGHNEAYY